MNLAQKILEVNRAAAAVEKRGENEEDGYRYVRVGDMLDVVEPLMQKQGLILTATVSTPITRTETPRGSIVDLSVYWTLEDVDTGQSRTYTIPGSGWGKDEKGTYKALTGSRKYAIAFIFALRVADEPEAPHDYPVDKESAKEKAQDIAQEKIKKLKEKLGDGTGQA